MRDREAISNALDNLNLGPILDATPVGGGDISSAFRIQCKDEPFMLKSGPLESEDLFTAEVDGLAEIAKTGAVRVPAVIATGTTDESAFIVMEWLELRPGDAKSDARLGEQLARLHRTSSSHFGWFRNNRIGLTEQLNPETESWLFFYREQRLRFQLDVARSKGFMGELQMLGDRVLQRLPAMFADYEPVPSLLHGDLWGGNKAQVNGEPVIYDPAVYFGDRETDIAMAQLFGGFDASFFKAYEATWPLHIAHRERIGLYQLYHILNHLNLFGSAYEGRAIALMKTLAG